MPRGRKTPRAKKAEKYDGQAVDFLDWVSPDIIGRTWEGSTALAPISNLATPAARAAARAANSSSGPTLFADASGTISNIASAYGPLRGAYGLSTADYKNAFDAAKKASEAAKFTPTASMQDYASRMALEAERVKRLAMGDIGGFSVAPGYSVAGVKPFEIAPSLYSQYGDYVTGLASSLGAGQYAAYAPAVGLGLGAAAAGYGAYKIGTSETAKSLGRKLAYYDVTGYLGKPDSYNCPESGWFSDYTEKDCANYCKDTLDLKEGTEPYKRCMQRINGPDADLAAKRAETLKELEAKLEKAESKEDKENIQKKIDDILGEVKEETKKENLGIRALLKAGAQYDRFVKAHKQVIKRAAIADRARNEGALYGNWAAESKAATLA